MMEVNKNNLNSDVFSSGVCKTARYSFDLSLIDW